MYVWQAVPILTNLTRIKKKMHSECCLFFILLHVVDIYSFAHRESEKTCCKLFSHLYYKGTNNINLSIPRNPKVTQHNYQSVKYLNKNSQKCLREQSIEFTMALNYHQGQRSQILNIFYKRWCGASIHPHKICCQGEMVEVQKTSQTNTAWQTIKPTSYMTNFQVSFPIKSM